MRGRGSWLIRTLWWTIGIVAAAIVLFVLSDEVRTRFGVNIGDGNLYLSAALSLVALTVFFRFLDNLRAGDAKPTEEHMRSAIAASVAATYLVLVGLASFRALVKGDQQLQLDPLAQTMLTSFTAIVAIVVPFYFGASAYVQAQREQRSGGAATPAASVSGAQAPREPSVDTQPAG